VSIHAGNIYKVVKDSLVLESSDASILPYAGAIELMRAISVLMMTLAAFSMFSREVWDP